MRIRQLRLRGIRCFDDTGDLELADKCNIFVGHNNAGKSTLLRGILTWQQSHFDEFDVRANAIHSHHSIQIVEATPHDPIANNPGAFPARYFRVQRGDAPQFQERAVNCGAGPIFDQGRPRNFLVPFLAKRKAIQFGHTVNLEANQAIDGTYSNLYARIDLVATAGHPRHELFVKSVKDIVGLQITTRASKNGKEAGFYIDDGNFVTLDRMGDGVSEMVALIVELCVERGKAFILEEPETNLHPKALKSLLSLVRTSSEQNQFFIATHSSTVLRDLAGGEGNRVFRVFRESDDPGNSSSIEVLQHPSEHLAVLRELGYEFADLQLHDAWLFLEEASAESVLQQVLIPWFAPKLRGRLRTFSAGGVDSVEPSLADFQRLIVFVHLQPAYEGRIWIRVDGDDIGKETIERIREKFPYLTDETASVFEHANFEYYYPAPFRQLAEQALALPGKKERREAKAKVLANVLEWSKQEQNAAKALWSESAAEPIELLKRIAAAL